MRPGITVVGVKELDAALGHVERILVDTTTLIAFHTQYEHVHALARHLMGRVEDDDDPLYAYYSAITASELMIRPIRSSIQDYAYMHAFLAGFPHLTFLPVDFPVSQQAASLRATHNIRTPDALIIASGLLAGCEAIVCNDKAWKTALGALFSQVAWIYLGDYA